MLYVYGVFDLICINITIKDNEKTVRYGFMLTEPVPYVLIKLYQVAIDHKELCEYDMMKVLDHILSQIATYLSEGGELLSEEEVLQDLRTLGEDAAVPLTIRVEALSLAEKVRTLCIHINLRQ